MDLIEKIGLIVFLPWLGLLVLKPRLLTSLVVFLGLIQLGWLTRYLGAPPIFNRITLAMAGLLGIKLAIDYMLKRQSLSKQQCFLKPVINLAVFFMVLYIVSNIYNRENLLLGFYEFRYYFFGLVLTFALYHYFGSKLSIVFFKKSIVGLALVQLPFALIKYIAAGGGTTRTLDSVSGTFGGYGELVACQMLALGVILFDKFTHGRDIFKLNSYFVSLLLIAPLLLSKSRLATIYIVILLIWVWLFSVMQRKSPVFALKRLIIAVGLCGLFGVFFYFMFWKFNYDLAQQFSSDYVFNYFMKDPVTEKEIYRMGADPRMGRIRAVVESFKLIFQHPANLIFGYGSGSVSEASFLNTAGQYHQFYGPLAGLDRHHYSKTISEQGLAGLCGFILFFAVLYFRLKKGFPKISEIRAVYNIILFCLILLSTYATTLGSFFFSFVIAFFLATVQVEYDNQYSRQNIE